MVLAEVDALLALELVGNPIDDDLVEVIAAEVGVAVRRFHLEHAVADVEDGDVERTAAEVVDRDDFVVVLIEAVGERGGCRLVDDAQNLQPCDGAGVFRGLALAVVEVRGDGDDSLRHGLAQLRLGVRLQLLQDDGGYLGRGVVLAAHGYGDVGVLACLGLVAERFLLGSDLGVLPADEPLHGVDGVAGVGDRLTLGDHAHVPFVALGVDRDDGRGGAPAFRVLEDGGLTGLHHGYCRVRRAQVYAYYLCHFLIPPTGHCCWLIRCYPAGAELRPRPVRLAVCGRRCSSLRGTFAARTLGVARCWVLRR